MGRGIREKWPVELIALKQYQRRKGGPSIHDPRAPRWTTFPGDPSESDLCSRLRAAECEILALSPSLFRNHPNIVQLLGWGLCLDTIENAASPCCQSLQTPLLVFERADMNMEQFLQQLFPGRTYPPDILAEEGSLNSSLRRQGMHLSQSSDSPGVMLRPVWKGMKRWTGLESDPYEVTRLLCIDIGHGLQSLHHHKFTHGDLKPANVLVFRTQERWLAKLCDFGCAVGKIEDTAENKVTSIDLRVQYCGTPGWQPPDDQTTEPHDFDGLRECDLYVYGLVVWSSFCLRGSPPDRATLGSARRDLDDLEKRVCRSFPAFVRGEPTLADKLRTLLKGSMASPSERDQAPWRHLYRLRKERDRVERPSSSEEETQEADNYNAYPLQPLSNLDRKPADFSDNIRQPPLPLDVKAQYNEKSWWSRPTGSFLGDRLRTQSTAGGALHSVNATAEPSVSPKRGTIDVSDSEDGFGPASSRAIDLDDNALAITVFEDNKHQEDGRRLGQDMARTLDAWDKSLTSAADLYYLARFRSRIKLAWWEANAETSNILARALRAQPAVNIDTLAWLCKGQVGENEVKHLRYDHLTPLFLNESERLDRLLLLLESGAPVWPSGYSRSSLGYFRSSILASYIQSCRLATVPTVVEQICHRLMKLEDHFVLVQRIPELLRELSALGNKAAVRAFEVHGFEPHKFSQRNFKFPERASLLGNFSGYGSIHHSRSQRTEDFLMLPPAWHKVSSTGRFRRPCDIFVEELTGSITLSQPRTSLIEVREVNIGFLMRDHCYLDVLPFVRPRAEGDVNQPQLDMTSRFPCYDDRWFRAEWNTQSNQEDVLSQLKDPWELPTFATRVRLPSFDLARFLAHGPWPLRLGFICLAFAYIIFAAFHASDFLPNPHMGRGR